MARISKAPEVRKQELIDVAFNLFITKGYEDVSVREILAVVNGAPGMFYYYFESKQEIYHDAMEQFVKRVVAGHSEVLLNKETPIIDRINMLFDRMLSNTRIFADKFHLPDNIPYELAVIESILTELANPVEALLIEALEMGVIKNTQYVNVNTAYDVSVFLINGCNGYFRNQVLAGNKDLEIMNIKSFSMHFLGLTGN